MRQAQQFRKNHPRLGKSQVVGLEARQNQVGLFGLERLGQNFCSAIRVEVLESRIVEVQRAVSALGQSFFDGLLRSRRTQARDHDLSAVLFLQPQALFKSVDIRFVNLKAHIGRHHPSARRVDS